MWLEEVPKQKASQPVLLSSSFKPALQKRQVLLSGPCSWDHSLPSHTLTMNCLEQYGGLKVGWGALGAQVLSAREL